MQLTRESRGNWELQRMRPTVQVVKWNNFLHIHYFIIWIFKECLGLSLPATFFLSKWATNTVDPLAAEEPDISSGVSQEKNKAITENGFWTYTHQLDTNSKWMLMLYLQLCVNRQPRMSVLSDSFFLPPTSNHQNYFDGYCRFKENTYRCRVKPLICSELFINLMLFND